MGMKNFEVRMATAKERAELDVHDGDRTVCLFYENGCRVGYIWYERGFEDDSLYIEYISAFSKNLGYGKAMVWWMFKNMPVTMLYGEANEDVKGFWEAIGADVDDEALDVSDMYPFVLRVSDFVSDIGKRRK